MQCFIAPHLPYLQPPEKLELLFDCTKLIGMHCGGKTFTQIWTCHWRSRLSKSSTVAPFAFHLCNTHSHTHTHAHSHFAETDRRLPDLHCSPFFCFVLRFIHVHSNAGTQKPNTLRGNSSSKRRIMSSETARHGGSRAGSLIVAGYNTQPPTHPHPPTTHPNTYYCFRER